MRRRHRAALRQAREAIRFTREYVDPTCYSGELSLLPALPGWSWFDAVVAIDEALGDGPSTWLTHVIGERSVDEVAPTTDGRRAWIPGIDKARRGQNIDPMTPIPPVVKNATGPWADVPDVAIEHPELWVLLEQAHAIIRNTADRERGAVRSDVHKRQAFLWRWCDEYEALRAKEDA